MKLTEVYYREGYGDFWKRINALKNEYLRQHMQGLGLQLATLEIRVLTALQTSEKIQKEIDDGPALRRNKKRVRRMPR